MINKTTFGSFIREKRLEKGLTQKELAELMFLSESAVSKWEMGKSYPDITLIPDLCRVLDVSEHELIGGANDTEYRQVKEEARLYRRISETFFWGFTGAYMLAFVICLICDLAIYKKPTFSVTVLASLLVAFTFIPTAIRFTKKYKTEVFFGSTMLSLTLLYLVCCVQYRQNWFGNAAMGTLLGYAVCFLPVLLHKHIPERHRNWRLPLYFAVCFALLILLLLTVRITVPFDLRQGLLITLFAAVPFAVTAGMCFVPCNGFFKAAADVFALGITAYGTQFCVSRILGYDASADYRINFADWVSCVNGNVYLLILLACILVSAVLLGLGIARKKRH